MEIILTKDVEKLGYRGDVVTVADGYARNFLLPRRLAERATPAKVAEVRKRDELRARQEARTAEQAQEVASVLAKTVLRFEVNAGPTGALFGSVTPGDIADEIWRVRKIRVDRRKIATEPIKRIGRYEVGIHVFEGVDVGVKTLVVPEGGELPPDEELEALAAAEAGEAAAEAGEAAPEAVDEPSTADAEAQVPADAFDRSAGDALAAAGDAAARDEPQAAEPGELPPSDADAPTEPR